MIGIVDTDAAYIYWVETSGQAGDIRRMLDLLGKGYKELRDDRGAIR